MKQINISNINLEKLGPEIEKHENQWIAVSDENKIVGSDNTFRGAIQKSGGKKNIVLFKVPSFSASLAPGAQ